MCKVDAYDPNAEKVARVIIQRRLALVEYLHDREVVWHGPSNVFALNPRLTWGEVRELFGGHLGGKKPHWMQVTDTDHFFPSNGKMIAPTWSIAPGPVQFGGSCVVSDAMFHTSEIEYPTDEGKSVARIPKAHQAKRFKALGGFAKPDASKWICNDCYALKSRYVFTPKIVKWVALQIWMKRVEDFASAMIDMMRHNIEYLMKVTRRDDFVRSDMADTSWPHPNYFRVHDAGDFFSVPYFEAWCEIAAAMPQVKFWAATRTWAVPKLADAFSRVKCPPNLVIRPSELYVDQPPRMHRWPSAPASAVASKHSRMRLPKGAIVCPVADVEAATCQNSGGRVSYRGKNARGLAWPGGCRACWEAKAPVIYMEH
jgi:hypothetical protein